MPHARARFGTSGERLAEEFLQRRGYRMIARNVRTRHGEIDLICRDGNELVFVEVKTRASHDFGPPEAAVTSTKQRHLIRSAQAYLATVRGRVPSFRIDVIAITHAEGGEPEIVHIPSAVGGTPS